MIDLNNQSHLNINITLLENIAQSLSQQEIEVIIMNEENIKHINYEYRNKNISTDVLSFPIETPFIQSTQSLPLGSILICDAFVIKNAKLWGHSEEEEVTLLFIHGLLHLLGFDHEQDKGEMRTKEKEIIQLFDLAESLIIRTEEA
jgi:probable rRNA maturation factor